MANQAIVTINDKQWPASLAIIYAELTTGLRGLPSLPAGTGMLFVLPRDQAVTVTTRGMLISIDIVFISGQLEVVDVALGVSPDLLVSESMPVRYFLEVNAGEAEGIAVGDVVNISVSQTVTEAGVGDWISPVVSFAGMMMVGAFMAKMGKTMAKAVFPKKTLLYGPSGERLLPQTARHKPACPECGSAKTYPSMGKRWFCNDCKHRWVPYLPQNKKHKPTRRDVEIGTWAERDRIGIWITDKRTGKSIAEWWDEDAEEMFEQGFFKPGVPQRTTEKPSREFVDSVLDYAESIGLLASGKYVAQTGTCYADSWRFLIKEGEGELIHGTVFTGGRRMGHAWVETSTGWVWEPQTGRYHTKLGFQATFAPVVEARYAAEEAAIMAARAKHLGPWTEQERQRYLKEKSPTVSPEQPRQPHPKGGLEFLPDSPEYLAYTIDDIGYRDRIDSAFLSAIARARGKQQ